MLRNICPSKTLLNIGKNQTAFHLPSRSGFSYCNRVPRHQQTEHTRSLSTSQYYLNASKNLKIVSKVEKKVKSYGYLELQNLDLDLVIKPASPDAFPDMDTAICSFFSNTEKMSPEFAYLDDMITIRPHKAYKTAEHECCVEIPIKYGN